MAGNKAHPAWWNVDLGTTYAITGLKIYNIDRHGKKVSFLKQQTTKKVIINEIMYIVSYNC